MNQLIRETASAGSAVVVSSHLLNILEGVCNKVLILEKGKSVLCGSLEELQNQRKQLAENPSLEAIFLAATGESKAA